MNNYKRLEGLVAATFTPMDKNGDINYPVIGKYAEHIRKSGIEGVFVCGTTGEFVSLTIDERKLILEEWIKSAKHKFKIIAHVGGNNQRESIELAGHAQKMGADGIASIAPSFFRPSSVSELIHFFEPLASAASDLPFYYYNIPSITGVDLPVAQFLHEGKKAIPNLSGVKFTHNNMMEMCECIKLDNGEFEVLHGFDETLICGLALGVVAGVGSTYNYAPELYLNIMKEMSTGNIEKARMYQAQSVELVKIIIQHGGGVRGGKAIMNLIGIECGNCRPPFTPYSKEELSSLQEKLQRVGLFN